MTLLNISLLKQIWYDIYLRRSEQHPGISSWRVFYSELRVGHHLNMHKFFILELPLRASYLVSTITYMVTLSK